MFKLIKRNVVLLITLSLLISCGGRGVKPNPCLAEKPVTAEFSIKRLLYDVKDMFGIKEDLFEVDTVLLPFRGEYLGQPYYYSQNVLFKADAKYDSVKWIIGNDERVFNRPSLALDFDKPYGKIDATCIVYKTPDSTCFPQDDGIDSLTKSVHILSDREFDYAFEGEFEGYNEDEPDKLFTITIKDMGVQPPESDEEWYGLRLHGLPEGCGGSEIKLDHYSPQINSRLYRQFVIKGSGVSDDCPDMYAYGEVIDEEISIKYRYRYTDPSTFITKIFKGKKVK